MWSFLHVVEAHWDLAGAESQLAEPPRVLKLGLLPVLPVGHAKRPAAPFSSHCPDRPGAALLPLLPSCF